MMHSSTSSSAVSVCSSKFGAVSTTTKSNCCCSVRSIRDTRAGVTRSRASGIEGAASTISESACRVSSGSTIEASRAFSAPIACSIEWDGKSCIVMATSPKARSRSTRQTCRAPLSARARREVDRHGRLADAALGREDGDDLAVPARAGRPAQGDVELVGTLDRRRQGQRVAVDDDLAHAGVHRLGQHLGVDLVAHQHRAGRGPLDPQALGHLERLGQRDPGPRTTTYSSERLRSQDINASVESTLWPPGGSVARSFSTTVRSGSTTMGTRHHPKRLSALTPGWSRWCCRRSGGRR